MKKVKRRLQVQGSRKFGGRRAGFKEQLAQVRLGQVAQDRAPARQALLPRASKIEPGSSDPAYGHGSWCGFTQENMTAPRTFSITTLDTGTDWAPGGKPGGGEPIQEAGGAPGGLH